MGYKMTSKFQIGDKVFILEDGKAIEKTIYGVISLFTEASFSAKQASEFDKFKYFTQRRKNVYEYDWIEEKNVFKNKEELIASL